MKSLVAFFEIPAEDFYRAVKFYESVLSIKMEIMDCETEKMAFFPKENNHCPGAISFAKDFKPSPNGTLISLTIEDMEKTVYTIEDTGGKIIIPKTKIIDSDGYFCVFQDTEGNRIGLYSKE